MPILQAESACFPENMWRGDAPTPELARRSWWVLHTRPRQEKSLARDLHKEQIPFFLPLIPRRSRIRNRTMTSYIPLFTGYVFMLAEGEERLTALRSDRIARMLPVADIEGLWGDLRQISRLIAAGAPLSPEGRLTPGMLVEIKSGPLAGLKGKIIREASRSRFVVEVDFIQRGVSVVVDDFTLHPA
jgi:transcription antitermination factor NusG